MHKIIVALLISLWASTSLFAQTAEIIDDKAFRVCGDPSNLPFSDKNKAGFENKVAELFAQELNIPVAYTWFPQVRGFLRKTLNIRKCDVVMGFAATHEMVLNSNPYYSSTYVMVFKKNNGLDGIVNLQDPRLKKKKIGVIAGTPPATIIARNKLISNTRPYNLAVDRRYINPGRDMVKSIISGELDIGLLWGPIGGYYAKKLGKDLVVVPMIKEVNAPRMVYRITLAVRRGDINWKHKLNAIIRKRQKDIHKILRDFGVPLLDNNGNVLPATPKG